jgi:RimJ/RimL family protein N-acetyltransferase
MRNLSWPIAISTDAPHRVWIRTAAAPDVESLGAYFETLSEPARRNRFMGAVSDVSKIAFDCLGHGRKPDCFTLVAESSEQARDAIIGEASYAFDRAKSCGEFAISVSDRWQRQGVASALLCALQFRAMSLGYVDLFGETLKTNHQMKNLAVKAGFEFTRSLDWRAVRFDKKLSGWRLTQRRRCE